MFTTTVEYSEGSEACAVDEVTDARLIVTSKDFKKGQHIEVKLLDDGGILVETWDEKESDFTKSILIPFDDLVDYAE